MSLIRVLKNHFSQNWVGVFLLSFAIAVPTGSLSAQQARIAYIYDDLYDDLGRLVRVINETGEAATYHYEAVGNILRITRD
jgi:YD repeat-containing protein